VVAFESNVFINCPFDKEYAPILQATLFAVVLLGFTPRLATERSDGGESRLEKIRQLIEESQYSIVAKAGWKRSANSSRRASTRSTT